MRFYRPYANFLRFIYRTTHWRWKIRYLAESSGPVAYVVHHQDMTGPIHAIGLMPDHAHIWALNVFCDRKACFDQFYHYTFRTRYGWPKAFSFLLAGLLSLLVPPILHAIRAIPVFHDAKTLVTFRESLACLQKGESLAICPDADYTSQLPSIGEIQEGFLSIERLYHMRTGRHLPFVPLYISSRRKEVVIGEAILFTDGVDFDVEQPRIVQEIIGRINAMGRDCGDIES